MNVQIEMVNLSIMVSAVTLGILLTKKILGNKISPKGHVLMWALILILILSWPLSQWMPEMDGAARSFVPQFTLDESRIESVLELDIKVTDSVVLVERLSGSMENYLFALWFVGSMVCALALTIGEITFMKKLSNLEVCENEDVIKAFDETKGLVGISRNISLKTGSENVMLAGILNPTVYIMEDKEADLEGLKHMFVHELTHYSHGDLFINLISAVLLCIFWWNPMVWIGFIRLRLDMEVYCDYDAVNLTKDKKGYSVMLVKAAKRGEFLGLATALVNRENQVAKRVMAIATFKEKSRIFNAVGSVLLIVAAVIIASVPATALQDANKGVFDIEAEADYTNVEQAVEYLESNLSLLEGMEFDGESIYLRFADNVGDSFWMKEEYVPEIHLKYNGDIVTARVERCTESYGRMIFDGLSLVLNDVIEGYSLETDGQAVVAEVMLKECKVVIN